LAVAIRTAQKGYIPDKSFILVGLGVTFVMMLGWRCGLAALTPDKVPPLPLTLASLPCYHGSGPLPLVMMLGWRCGLAALTPDKVPLYLAPQPLVSCELPLPLVTMLGWRCGLAALTPDKMPPLHLTLAITWVPPYP
jgi:hypothetical protein